MVQVVCVRHAQSVGNKVGVRQGHLDFPLSVDGIENASTLQDVLNPYDIEHIYHSDLRRAKETVEYSTVDSEIPRTETQLLREMDFGVFNGISTSVTNDALPYSIDDEPILKERWPDGESYLEFINRIRTFCQTVAVEHTGLESVAVVAHQGTILSVRDLAQSPPLMKHSYEDIPNLGGFVFDITCEGVDVNSLSVTEGTQLHVKE